MLFIGIITDQKSENDIKRLLANNNFLTENNVIFIKEKNIDNIKNVHFDTVFINKEFDKMDKLNKLLENTKNVIVNMDTNIDNKELNIVNSNLITYGFNSKSSITISSVTDDDVLICLQRNIYNNYGEIEVQEIKIENNPNYSIYDLIIVLTLFLLYLPMKDKININGIK
ncbi:MAG: hypothetical protein IJ890_07100 [Clostridia bacterium]|nr:hypothetical protein [Clostridia bacterium]